MPDDIENEKLTYLHGEAPNSGQFFRVSKRSQSNAAQKGWETRQRKAEIERTEARQRHYLQSCRAIEDMAFDFSAASSPDTRNTQALRFYRAICCAAENGSTQNDIYAVFRLAALVINQTQSIDLAHQWQHAFDTLINRNRHYILPSEPFLSWYAELPEGALFQRANKVAWLVKQWKYHWDDMRLQTRNSSNDNHWYDTSIFTKRVDDLIHMLTSALAHPAPLVREASLGATIHCMRDGALPPVAFSVLTRSLKYDDDLVVAEAAHKLRQTLSDTIKHDRLQLRREIADLKTAFNQRCRHMKKPQTPEP